jgi:hypothetical protein
VERLGGSAGVQNAIDRQATTPQREDPPSFPNCVAANLNSASILLATYVNINTTDGHTGDGWAVGFGGGGEITGGILSYTSWEELMSEPNSFAVFSIEEGVAASFWIGDKPVAYYVGTGLELDVSLDDGWFTWTVDDSNERL